MSEYAIELTEKDKRIAKVKDEYYSLVEKDKLEKLREQFDTYYEKQRYEDHPKIFVYTPTYNRGDIFKDRAFPSVLNQSYDNFEYLVVGDNCTDNTEEIVTNCGDSRVHYFQVPQRAWRYPPTAENHWFAGPVVAENTALRMANGDWIARIDDDDVWVEDHLETMLHAAIEGKWEFVSGALQAWRDGVGTINKGEYLYGDYFGIPYPNGDESSYNPRIGGISTTLYRSYLRYFEFNEDCWRKSINRVNDLDLLSRFGLMGVKMGFVDRVELIIKPRPGNTTIGSDAYRRNPEAMEKHFVFDNNSQV